MKKHNARYFVLGMVACLILVTFVVPAAAASLSKTAELFYRDIKITVNGEAITPKDANGKIVEPFIIDGTTYLPVRAVASALGLDVNWDSATSTAALGTQKADGFDSATVASQLKVVKEYTWETKYSNYIAIVIKNTSDYTISPRVQLSLKDAAGNIVGAKNESDHAFGPGSEMAFVFSNDEEFSDYSYVLSASEEEYYAECVSKLEKKVTLTSEKAILEVKNNGTKAAEFTEYIAIFLKNGEPVDYSRGYCVDDDAEIKPGATEMEEITCYDSFDDVEIYLTAKAHK